MDASLIAPCQSYIASELYIYRQGIMWILCPQIYTTKKKNSRISLSSFVDGVPPIGIEDGFGRYAFANPEILRWSHEENEGDWRLGKGLMYWNKWHVLSDIQCICLALLHMLMDFALYNPPDFLSCRQSLDLTESDGRNSQVLWEVEVVQAKHNGGRSDSEEAIQGRIFPQLMLHETFNHPSPNIQGRAK